MNRYLCALLGLASLGLTSSGCTEDGGDGPPSVANPAVAATLSQLGADVREGTTNLDATITQGTIANPFADPTGGTTAGIAPVGGNDGTATVDVTQTVDFTNTNGQGTQRIQVTLNGGSFLFLDLDLWYDSPFVSFRDFPFGYSNVAADGTGQAFILMRVLRSGTIDSVFSNSAPGGETLVNFGGITPALTMSNRSGVFDSFRDYIVEYQISLVAGVLEAKIVALYDAGGIYSVYRSGGPTSSQVVIGYPNQVTVNGTTYDPIYDVGIPVGTDADSGGAPTNATVVMLVDVTGGVGGVATFSADVDGEVTPTINSSARTFQYTGTLNNITMTGDGTVQLDQFIRVLAQSDEDPTNGGDLVHTLDGQLGPLPTLEAAVYLANASTMERKFILLR